jgi:hypothetical protein
MSQENVELLRQANEAFNRGDLDGFLAFCGEDLEVEDLRNAPDLPRVAHGKVVRATLHVLGQAGRPPVGEHAPAGGRVLGACHSRLAFTKIRTYALKRLVLFMSYRYNRTSRYGWTVVNYHSRNQLGLISLDRLVVTPSPSRDWRVKRDRPNAGGEGRR